MTFLPIVERELRVAARLTATYRNRMLAAGVVTGVAVLMLTIGGASGSPAFFGRALFSILSYLALLFCLQEGVRKTADCLSEEKREGTLGLLFLTDLKGYDVVLGKFVGMSLASFYGLLAILPILALPMLLGGVTQGEFWRMALALVNILFFSLCTGIWVSSWSRGEREAMGRALSIIVFLAVAAFFAQYVKLFAFSPVYAFRMALESRYFGNSGGYWQALGFTQIASWAMLVWASLALPRTWQEKAVRAPLIRRWQFGNAGRRAKERTRMLDLNPVFWLAARDHTELMRSSFIAAIVFACATAFMLVADADYAPVLAGFYVILNLVIKMRVARQATQCLTEARRNNALEMLLATPLTVEEIINGQFMALKRAYLIPIVLILGMEFFGLLMGIGISQSPQVFRPNISGDVTAFMFLTLAYLPVCVLEIFAVIWAGMWFGLSARQENQAALKTILLVLVVPMFIAPFYWCFGYFILIGLPIFWILWARSELRLKFRELASRPFAPKKDSGWIPGVERQESRPPLVSTQKP